MLLLGWLLLLGEVWSGWSAIAPADDVKEKIIGGNYFPEIVKHLSNGGEDRWLKQYFGKHSKITWIDEDNNAFKNYKLLIENGLTMKGLTFNVYDDSMREEAIALFRLFYTLDLEKFHMTTAWASINVNDGVLEYALRLAILYNKNLGTVEIPPPFSIRSNYFFNSETLRKANYLRLRNGIFVAEEAKVNQYYRTNDIITINTNYSGWNLLGNGCAEKLAYFREDIGLNSFYYSVHLLYPFWMANDELEKLNPGRAEHYYYIHQQLLARYYLEMEANGVSEAEAKVLDRPCDFPSYNTYLEYRNGLPFPVRYPYDPRKDETSAAYLSSVDTIIKELASRGLLIMTNGTRLNFTDENQMDLLAKLIRANVDGVKYAKAARSLYGAQGYPVDKYNPAPSALHHPETSLRDPIFWSLLSSVLDYFNMFKFSSSPHNLTEYENDDIGIVQIKPITIATYFEYFQADISNAIGERFDSANQRKLIFTARQRRLAHYPFSINFDIVAKRKTFAIVRLYLGPRCKQEECFSNYNRWYELDTFKTYFDEGTNHVNWSPNMTEKYSPDDSYNLESSEEYIGIKKDNNSKYNVFKFPERLVIPKGALKGLNMSLFVMVTEDQVANVIDNEPIEGHYLQSSVYYHFDDKPLGFPFDRYSINFNADANNYKFFDVIIKHKTDEGKKSSGYFSTLLN